MPRILVVEDDESYRSVLVDTLSSKGYQVDTAESGLAGIALAQHRLPDLILCDIVMAGMDGYGVLKALRRDLRTATIPVIFLTGLAGGAALRKGMDSGADDYLEKPVSKDDLLRAIEARMARRAEMRREVEQGLTAVRAGLVKSLPHEFLTPLTVVMGLSSLLMDDSAADIDIDTAREIAQGIFVGSQQLQGIATKFLLYAELESEAGARGTPLEAARAAKVIREAAEAKAVRALRPEDLRLEIDEIPSPLSLDHLQPLVDELVENAFSFSNAGSPVTVGCRRDGNDWVLSVADEGPGMAPEQLEALDTQMPFSRRHGGQPGIGLGLAIARRLARLYSGGIEFRASDPGTRVQARVPAPA